MTTIIYVYIIVTKFNLSKKLIQKVSVVYMQNIEFSSLVRDAYKDAVQ